jgi:hypothetical protein
MDERILIKVPTGNFHSARWKDGKTVLSNGAGRIFGAWGK